MKRTIVAALLATVAVTGARADTNWWVPPGDVDRASLVTLDELETAYAELAWETFIAINWPALVKDGNPYPSPDTDKDLSYNVGEYVSVWEAWPTAQEIFRPDGTAPPAWGSPHELPSPCEEKGALEGHIVLQATSKGGDVASEFVQAFRMGPVPDQNGKYTWFAIQANKAMYDYIVGNGLYNVEGQVAFGKAADWPRGRLDSTGSEEDIGSIFVKGAWKVLGDGDNPNAFHRIQARLYNPGDEDAGISASCRLESVGLTALHIVHRTNSAQQWAWATFEHVANAPLYEEAMSGDLRRSDYSYFDTAVLLVHHARKSGATRPGQAPRGSSKLHAWGDSNLYLRRRDKQIVMTVEHRAAPGLNDIEIELVDDGRGPALRLRQAVADESVPEPETAEQRILQALADAETPLSQRQIRERAATRPATVAASLRMLIREDRVERVPEGGYRLVGESGETGSPVAGANGQLGPEPLPKGVTASNP
ncbi:MAG: hypothetical protein F4Y02_11680 [Chloroflexi bacterium]|nr:hypothetical protein [Chloroflexota bacterium]